MARRGEGITSPNPPVGALYLKRERVVGSGFHARFGGPHAEVEAARNCRGSLKGATLVVTLEPCSHFGKTPPCADFLIESGVRRVIVGMLDPNPRVHGRGVAKLRRAGIDVVVRNLPEIIDFYRPYTTYQRLGRCHVTLKLAVSSDGAVATAAGYSKWITGPAARRDVQSLRRRVDAILVGRETAALDDPRLTVRPPRTRPPVRLILTRFGRLSRNLRLLTDSAAPTLVVTGRAGAKRLKWTSHLTVAERAGRLDIGDLARRLAHMGVLHLLVEGGGVTAGSFLAQGLVDDMVVYVAPVSLGASARPMFVLPRRPHRLRRFDFESVTPISRDLRVHLVARISGA